MEEQVNLPQQSEQSVEQSKNQPTEIENQVLAGEPVESITETGILIYHLPTNTKCCVQAKVKQGQGRLFINSIPLEELINQDKIKPYEAMINVLQRERLKELDIDLDIDDPSWAEHFPAPVLTYITTEALTNLLGRL